jgi:histone-lysine N-methyltransferase SETD3
MPRKKARPQQKAAAAAKRREEEAQKLTPTEAGNHAFVTRNYAKAIEFWTKALITEPNDQKLLSNRSLAHWELQQFDQALADANAVIGLAPEWSKGYLRKGKALRGTYKYIEAKEAFGRAFELDPTNKEIKSGLDDCTLAITDLQLAESEEFKKANPDAHVMDALIEWLTEGKIHFPKLYMQWYSPDFRGVQALDNLHSGECILSVPISHIMVGEEAKRCAIGHKILTSGYEVNSDDSFLAAYILQEKHTPNSFWKPYIDSLPQAYENMPIYFGDELLSELEGSFSLEMRAARIESLQEEYDGICQAVPEFRRFTHDEFVWARLVVITRQFGVTVDGVETDGLVPYADMLNHKLPRETEWTYDEKNRQFTIHALQSMKRGVQVFDSYGRKCNSRFFVNYGFSLDENPDNEAVIRLELQPSDPSYVTKCNLLASRYARTRRCQIPATYANKKTLQMFTFLRFIHAQGPELAQVMTLDTKNPSDHKLDPLTIRNETLVLTELKQKALYSLSLFKTTIAEDEKLKDTVPMYSNIRNCYIMRLGEKKVLQWFADLATVCLPMLHMSLREIKALVPQHTASGMDKYILHVVVPLVKGSNPRLR